MVPLTTSSPSAPSAEPPVSDEPITRWVARSAVSATFGALHTDQGRPSRAFGSGSASGAPSMPTGRPRGVSARELREASSWTGAALPTISRAEA